ncbi:MAG: GTPase HflX [Clostridiales bacterium GWF2_38_85]|nr:MAG: GTPase HflX [Clostridiales bacterium GWF2_38_85]HBL84151.1 GTPase HflX [Clostridiales bacterium]
MILKEFNEKKPNAVLVALGNDETTEESISELERLLDTAGAVCVARITQPKDKPDTKTYIGSGKAKELSEFIKTRYDSDDEISLVVFDDELSPSQIANLEDILDCPVIDRTMLILDIFAQHATTAEGKLQVEIACLRYTAPRLIGKGAQLSRLAGGIGTRGPGESKLESDRRHLKRQISALESKINDLERTRSIKRARRLKSGIKTIAIVGYTNAGKSTLMNALTNAGILAEDKLFATLDPTTRKLRLPSGKEFLITDTVGFVSRLPHHLVKAFKSTLEEVKYADIIIRLVDASEKYETRMMKQIVTDKLLEELGATDKPTITIYNKYDVAIEEDLIPKDAISISAKTGKGIQALISNLEVV